MKAKNKKSRPDNVQPPQNSTDRDCIPELIRIASSNNELAEAQKIAAKALSDAGEPPFPHNACAATLSALLEMSGIDIPMTLGAGRFAYRLGGQIDSRGWVHIPVSEQIAGDIGVTFDLGGNPGADHVYLVVIRMNDDEMMVADNQAKTIHQRFARGDGKTPTDYFLRAPSA